MKAISETVTNANAANFKGNLCEYSLNFKKYKGQIIDVVVKTEKMFFRIKGNDGSLVDKLVTCSTNVLTIFEETAEVHTKANTRTVNKELMSEEARNARRKELGEMYVGLTMKWEDAETGECCVGLCKTITIDKRTDTEMLVLELADKSLKRFTSNKVNVSLFDASDIEERDENMLKDWIAFNFKPEKPLDEQIKDVEDELKRLTAKLALLKAKKNAEANVTEE